jgi:hypothetical protein
MTDPNLLTKPRETKVEAALEHKAWSLDDPFPMPQPRTGPDDESVSPSNERGLRVALKDWFFAVRCRLAWHSRQWSFDAEGACAQSSTCANCGRDFTRTKHRREWTYLRDRDCAQERTCSRCNVVDKTRTHHEEWGPTYYPDEDTGAHKCVRCGEVETWDRSDPD